MNNITRDRTNDASDPDNPGVDAVPKPLTPAPDNSAHVPGGATELAELERTLEPPTSGKRRSDKAP